MLEIANKTKQKINQKTAQALADYVLRFYKKEALEVSLVIIGDKKMQSLNYQFRGVDKTTDVLSFSPDKLTIKNSPEFLGEIFINIQEAARTFKYQEMFGDKKTSSYIFYFLLVHGLLHLLGYDDKTEKGRQAMIILGSKFLSGFFQKKVV
ncbi:MAG: rRNA maturation RNase YbeY [Candidatus Falkowbacteria bacterium]|nr:MAG: rRNA maturation RNase YbeY [Candidatus Falkowbacteria bacterium]